MKLPFAVYTAREGYQWISGLDAGLPWLEQLRRAVGKLPEFDFGDPLSCGAVNLDDTVVVYKFMKEIKGDFRGRDSLYLALTYFDKSVAGSINFEELLADEVFVNPMREPPSSIEYDGGVSIDSGADLISIGAGIELPAVGSLFLNMADGVLKVVQVEGRQQCTAVYQRPPAEVGFAGLGEENVEQPEPQESVSSGRQAIRFWFEIAILTILVAVFFAMLYLLRGDLFHGTKPDHPSHALKITDQPISQEKDKSHE